MLVGTVQNCAKDRVHTEAVWNKQGNAQTFVLALFRLCREMQTLQARPVFPLQSAVVSEGIARLHFLMGPGQPTKGENSRV